jgi:hypothetical protein
VILRPQRTESHLVGSSARQEPVPIRSRQTRQARDRQGAPPRMRIQSSPAPSTRPNECLQKMRGETCGRPKKGIAQRSGSDDDGPIANDHIWHPRPAATAQDSPRASEWVTQSQAKDKAPPEPHRSILHAGASSWSVVESVPGGTWIGHLAGEKRSLAPRSSRCR